jgi:hypothetical protein
MGETVSGIGAEGDRRQPLDDRSYLAVDLATSEMGAIKLEPIKAVTGKAGELGINYGLGKELDILAACAGAYQRIEHELARRFRFQNNIGHFMQPLNVPRRLDPDPTTLTRDTHAHHG